VFEWRERGGGTQVTNPQSAQFRPAELLDAGRRAAAEGRYDFAQQFFRHLLEHYPQTHEAAAARDGLARLLPEHVLTVPSGAVHQPAQAMSQPGATPYRPVGVGPGNDRSVPSQRAPAVAFKAGYRSGRALARLLAWFGGICFVVSLALLTLALFTPRILANVLPKGGWLAGAAAAGVAGGLMAVLLGQAFRALFDLANLSRASAGAARTLGEDANERQ
jgi:hypothetical protein